MVSPKTLLKDLVHQNQTTQAQPCRHVLSANSLAQLKLSQIYMKTQQTEQKPCIFQESFGGPKKNPGDPPDRVHRVFLAHLGCSEEVPESHLLRGTELPAKVQGGTAATG